MKLSNSVNSDENIAKMQDDIQIFVKEIYTEFIKINVEINQNGVFKPINFKEVANKMGMELARCKELYEFLYNNFDKETLKKKVYTYSIYKETLENFMTLLELDIKMDNKLYEKSQGGKYGYFEYRKDSKIRNAQANKVVELVTHLGNNFTITSCPRETELMIENCKKIFIDFNKKYDKCVCENSGYANLREELCNFYDRFMIMPFSPSNKQFRDSVLMTITDFIELIEYRENKAECNKISILETRLTQSLEIIKNEIYGIIV